MAAAADQTPAGDFEPAPAPKTPRGRRRRRWLIAVTSVFAVFALLHWGGGALAKHVVNRKLAKMDGYSGQVAAVKLALWRGTVEVKDFVLRERDKPNEPPLVRVAHARFPPR